MTTLLVTHPACLDHLNPAGHPERPDRLRAIERSLAEERFQALMRRQAPAATLDLITRCHPADCQVSNGPVSQPKPQRNAKSMSRAVCAIEPR